MRRSVCPFVGLWVIRSVRFKCVCVFFWARAVYWTAYVIPRCHGEGPSPDSTPPCPFYQKFHACIWAARWQRVSISSSEQKLLARLQIGRLGLSLQLSWMTILCFLKAFWKLSFLSLLSLWSVGELLVDVRTFENVILPFLFNHSRHQLW